ncbi:MAG: hypothetical protein ACREJS_08055 [Candidatus Rokuibacteriota bacterium]
MPASLRSLMQGPLPVTAPLVLTLANLGALGFRIVVDPSTPLLAAFAAWKNVYADLAAGFGAGQARPDWGPLEHEMLGVVELEKLLAVDRETVENG